MDARHDIEKRINKERQIITDLQGKIERSESFIQGLQEALRILPKDGTIKSSKRNVTIRANSDMAKIRDLIGEAGRPMYISEIVMGLGREDTKSNRMSIAGSLGRYVRKGVVFDRPGPNLFSLIGMQESVSTELPPAFGAEEIPANQPDKDPSS